jgi:hypothetical protein
LVGSVVGTWFSRDYFTPREHPLKRKVSELQLASLGELGLIIIASFRWKQKGFVTADSLSVLPEDYNPRKKREVSRLKKDL